MIRRQQPPPLRRSSGKPLPEILPPRLPGETPPRRKTGTRRRLADRPEPDHERIHAHKQRSHDSAGEPPTGSVQTRVNVIRYNQNGRARKQSGKNMRTAPARAEDSKPNRVQVSKEQVMREEEIQVWRFSRIDKLRGDEILPFVAVSGQGLRKKQ